MKSFFLSVIQQIFAFVVSVFLLVILFCILIWMFIAVIEKDPVYIPKNSVLVIDLSTTFTDAEGHKQFIEHAEDLLHPISGQTAYLLEVLDAIEIATKDPRIIGIFLKGRTSHSHQSSGYPILHEIRKAIELFQKSDKPVMTYFTEGEVKDYYLGSVANTIALNPLGCIQLKGLSVEMTYFGEAFERYGIGMQVTKSGKYKSAAEPYTSSHMSSFEKEQMTELLDDIWNNVSETIAVSRNLNKKDLQTLTDEIALFLPDKAINYKLVDSIEYESQTFERFNVDQENKKDSPIHKITLRKYINETKNKKLIKRVTGHKSKIAIIYAEGDILEGNGTAFNSGSDRLERRLNEARENDDVKAVVLRVNSTGGGAHASEKILRAVRLLQTKKPLVVSFGSYAASGGYWISCYGDTIFADPMTITGSIGVFGLLPNIEKLAKNYGINFEEISTSPFSTIDSYLKPRTAEEIAKLQEHTDLMYLAFLNRVAEGRKLDLKDVENIANGRIWSGFKAKQIGLVDNYGGLKDAINHAALIAKLSEDWEIYQYSGGQGIGFEILQFFQGASEDQASVEGIFNNFLKSINKGIKNLSSFNDPSSIYARIPYGFSLN